MKSVIIKFILPFSLFVFLLSFSDIDIKNKLVDELSYSYAKRQYENRGFKLCSIGGSIPEKIRLITLGFQVERCVNIEEARRIYVESFEELRDQINSDLRIRPHLEDHPIKLSNIKFSLSFRDQENKVVTSPYIAYISLINDKIYYRNYNHETKKLCTIMNEPYEEALKIVLEMTKS